LPRASCSRTCFWYWIGVNECDGTEVPKERCRAQVRDARQILDQQHFGMMIANPPNGG